MSNQPLRIFTDRCHDFDMWMRPLCCEASRQIALTPLWTTKAWQAPFMVPFFSDFGGLSLFISQNTIYTQDVYDLLEQAKEDKFRAVYLLDGQQDVMLFRNKYCEKLTSDYVLSAPGDELRSLAWAGAKENVGLLTLKPVGV